MVTTADTEDAVTIAAMDTAAVSGGILPGGRCDTLPPLHRHHQSLDTDTIRSSPAALPSLPPPTPPLAVSRVLLVPSVGPAMGVMLLALLVAFLVAMMPLPVKTGFLRCFAGTDRVSPWWRAARMATGNGKIVEMRAKTRDHRPWIP